MIPRDRPTAIKVQTDGHNKEKQFPDPTYLFKITTRIMIPQLKTKMSKMVKKNAVYSKVWLSRILSAL